MSDAMGAIHYGGDQPNPFGIGGASRDVAISEDTARMLDVEVRTLLEDSKQTAHRILVENNDLLHRMGICSNMKPSSQALYEFLAQTLVDGERVSLPRAPEPVLPESPGKDFEEVLADEQDRSEEAASDEMAVPADGPPAVDESEDTDDDETQS